MSVDVSLCMITYNKLPFLKKSIPAILDSLDESKSFEFLIFDNGSNDGTKEYLLMFSHVCPENVKCHITFGDENIGLNAYGMIVPHSTGKIVVTVDDDIFEIAPLGWEDRFAKILFSKFGGKRFGYVSTDTINEDGGRYDGTPLGIAKIDGLTVEVGPAGGWFTATTQEVLSIVGGFHTGQGAMHLEDADYQNRVWDNGLMCGTLLDTKVFHARAPRFYKELGVTDTYIEKARLAALEGITLEPIA